MAIEGIKPLPIGFFSSQYHPWLATKVFLLESSSATGSLGDCVPWFLQVFYCSWWPVGPEHDTAWQYMWPQV